MPLWYSSLHVYIMIGMRHIRHFYVGRWISSRFVDEPGRVTTICDCETSGFGGCAKMPELCISSSNRGKKRLIKDSFTYRCANNLKKTGNIKMEMHNQILLMHRGHRQWNVDSCLRISRAQPRSRQVTTVHLPPGQTWKG